MRKKRVVGADKLPINKAAADAVRTFLSNRDKLLAKGYSVSLCKKHETMYCRRMSHRRGYYAVFLCVYTGRIVRRYATIMIEEYTYARHRIL